MTDSISRNSVTMAKCSAAFNPVKFTNFQKIRQQLWSYKNIKYINIEILNKLTINVKYK
jgi:hypothetical protein